MILNFLQTRDPPILPALHQREHERYIANDGSEAGFDDNMDALQGFGKENKETLAQLLFHFFRRYGHEIDYDKSVVSVRHGKLLLRSEKSWDSAKEALSRLCVEEPFNTTRNLGNTADATAFRGIHLEIRQAFDYLANGAQLDKLCEPFEFPPEEKNIFKKPTPGARPILPQLPPNMRRNAPAPVSMRAPRNPQGMRSSPGYRRASGGAAFSNMRPPYGYQQQVNYSHHDALEQLRQGFLMKQNQIEALKAQLAAQSHAQQAYAHAQTMQANIAQAQAQVQAGLASPQTQVFMNGPRTPKLGERHSAVYNPYNYSYYPHYDFAQTMALAASQDGTRTNPTSPSLSTVTPATRRGLQRSVTGNGFQSSANRSQSQPARGLPYHILAATGYPPVPTYDPANYATTPPQLNGVNGVDVAQGYSDLPLRSARALSIADSQSNSGSPREYVGYYVDDSPQMAQTQPLPQQKFANFQLPPIPSYGELRKQRVSSDLHPPSSISTRRLSRSPSPLGHMRSFSTASGLRSAPLPSLPLPRQRTDSGQQTAEMNGPLIVNGSYSTAMPSATWEAQSTPSEVQPELNDRFAGNFASTGTAPSSMQSAYDIFGIQQPIETASEASVTDSEHAAAPVQVNGIHSNSPKPPNGIIIASSTPQQSTEPFPPLSRASPESVQSQENHVLTVSPPSAPAIPTRSPWRDVAASKGPVPPLDLSGVSDVPSALSSGKALLSPVMETRTPSPTANRRDGSLKSFKSNGSISMPNGTHAGSSKGSAQYIEQPENTTLANRSNKQHPSRTDAGQGNGASASNQKQQQSGQWQPASKKKKRGRARSNAQKMENGYKAENGPKPGEGEPMPANEAERKGG